MHERRDDWDNEQQRKWVDAARRFRDAAVVMSGLWEHLDEQAQSQDLCTADYPFSPNFLKTQGCFDEGPLFGICEWLAEEKLAAIERRASGGHNHQCKLCGWYYDCQCTDVPPAAPDARPGAPKLCNGCVRHIKSRMNEGCPGCGHPECDAR